MYYIRKSQIQGYLTKQACLAFTPALMLSQLRWAGHVARMPDRRLPKRLFYSELQQGVRSNGGRRKRFKDTLSTSMKAINRALTHGHKLLCIELDGATLLTKAPIHVKKGQLQRNKRDRQGKSVPAINRRSSICLVQTVTAYSVHASA